MKKKHILFLFFLITFLSNAQEMKTIKVIGKAIHIDNKLKFEGTVSLNATYSNIPAKEMTLAQMKFKYNEVLEKNGLSLTDLEENPIGYLYIGYEKEGMLYHFKTSSSEKFNSFLASTSLGTLIFDYSYSIIISEKEASLAISKAIENAKEKAQIIAKSVNKELGNIIHIEDNNQFNKELKNQPLYYDQIVGEYNYYVIVTFELKSK